jgi:hypothetical protein
MNGGIVLCNLVLNKEKTFVFASAVAYDDLNLRDLIGSAKFTFYKEFPDEYGSDGVNLTVCQAS